MQRLYDVPKMKKLDTKEYYELRENTPQEPLEKPGYKIPSSSNLLNGNSGSSNNNNTGVSSSSNAKSYKAANHAYPPEDYQQNYKTSQQYISPRGLHCIVIADHILDCPICSRFYRNYTPFYNIIIMILLILLVFLFIRCQKLSILATAKSFLPAALQPSSSSSPSS